MTYWSSLEDDYIPETRLPVCRNVTPRRSLAGKIADGAVMSGLAVAVTAADSDPLALAILLFPFALTYFIARRMERNARRG